MNCKAMSTSLDSLTELQELEFTKLYVLSIRWLLIQSSRIQGQANATNAYENGLMVGIQNASTFKSGTGLTLAMVAEDEYFEPWYSCKRSRTHSKISSYENTRLRLNSLLEENRAAAFVRSRI